MDEVDPRVKSWISTSFDEDAKSFSVWYEDDENLQIFACLEDKVMILDMFWDDGLLMENNSLVIKSLNWQQSNSIQTHRMSDGMVRFRHKQREIMLNPVVEKPPEWGASLLETWLSEMKENKSNLKSKKQRIADLKRTRESIRKMLSQSDMSTIENEIGFIEHRLQTADNRLSGKKADYSSSEE